MESLRTPPPDNRKGAFYAPSTPQRSSSFLETASAPVNDNKFSPIPPSENEPSAIFNTNTSRNLHPGLETHFTSNSSHSPQYISSHPQVLGNGTKDLGCTSEEALDTMSIAAEESESDSGGKSLPRAVLKNRKQSPPDPDDLSQTAPATNYNPRDGSSNLEEVISRLEWHARRLDSLAEHLQEIHDQPFIDKRKSLAMLPSNCLEETERPEVPCLELEPIIKSGTKAEFDIRISQKKKKATGSIKLPMIEVITRDDNSQQAGRGSNCGRALPAATTNGAAWSRLAPFQVTIRSKLLLDHLESITEQNMGHNDGETQDDDNIAVIFLYPFRLFIRFEKQIRCRIDQLRAIHNTESPTTPHEHVHDSAQLVKQTEYEETGACESVNADKPQESGSKPTAEERISEHQKTSTEGEAISGSLANPAKLNSKEAYIQLQLIIQLFEHHLSPVFELYRSLCEAKSTKIAFKDLWLLFHVGELAYLNVQPPSTSAKPFGLAKVFQVTENLTKYRQGSTGGHIQNPHIASSRPGNNDWQHNMRKSYVVCQSGSNTVLSPFAVAPQEKNTPECAFIVRCYVINSDGENSGPEQIDLVINAWDGEMDIRELMIFPERFCLPGVDFPQDSLEEWKKHLVEGGKKYSRFTKGAFMQYEGFHTDIEFPYVSEYTSRQGVVIDMELIRQDHGRWACVNWDIHFSIAGVSIPRKEFGISEALKLYESNPRKIEESEVIITTDECNGLRLMHVLHDDSKMDYHLAQVQREGFGLSSGTFKQTGTLESLLERDFALFPQQICGFLLRDKRWSNFWVDKLEPCPSDAGLWNQLQLQPKYKKVLYAAVQGHMQSEGLDVINFDQVEGKGQGLVILLHGPSGVGKTFTAEAIAAYTHKPLYAISCGEIAFEFEGQFKILNSILQRARRWRCILLLEEVDVLFLRRSLESDYRNGIVSRFLRDIDYFPGIVFLTTNRMKELDHAILSRVSLPLCYLPLNKAATGKIWSSCLRKIQRFKPSRASGQPRILVKDDDKALWFWWKENYENATANRSSWWSGRQIQSAFHRAVALAINSEKLCKIADVDPDSEDSGEFVRLKPEHFELVASIYTEFKDNSKREYLTNGSEKTLLPIEKQDGSGCSDTEVEADGVSALNWK